MPTYAQLQAETVWLTQSAPPALVKLASRLSEHFGTPVWIAGDNAHTYGRHRSRDWCLKSRWCPEDMRWYGTTDARDKRGDGSWYRAFDLAVQGKTLHGVCKRVDAAVRAGKLPGLAEWFGTFDSLKVVGWFEGAPSTSDLSHLTHFHGGFWTESADDERLMSELYTVMTGDDMSWGDPVPIYRLDDKGIAQPQGVMDAGRVLGFTNVAAWSALAEAQATRAEVTALRAVVEQLAQAITSGGGSVDTAAILAGVDERLSSLRDKINSDVRDAVADGLEGGAAQVRAE